jgi:hypothetical protein
MPIMSLRLKIPTTLTVLFVAFAVTGCGLDFTHDPIPVAKNKSERVYEKTTKHGTIFGPDGLNSIFGNNNSDLGGGAGGAVPVNSYLWRATLDTLSFMPLASADPFGGVVITDWYAPPGGSSADRFKMTVYILSRELRADGLRVALFRQTQDPNGQWVEAEVDGSTPVELENAILTRAREMRIAGVVE